MLEAINHTPPWLCRSSGASLFASNLRLPPQKDSYEGPQRCLAKRGTEIFVVVDNELRWSNLVTLKDQWESVTKPKGNASGDSVPNCAKKAAYRILIIPVYGKIKQLIVSPNGVFMAIITPHTVHISVLPDESHLSGNESSPIRLKTYQLGPTTHVIPDSPVVSALWHPLGVHNNLGGCILTVTADAAVRVWELDRNNSWSFDQPTLAIDLKKLVDGISSDEDFSPSGFGENKGFSADSFDMEVASACFGGSGHAGENAWAPMTLWVAMRPGDIYALCPLLPSRWQAPSTSIPSLSATIIPKLGVVEEESGELTDELMACRQQYEWLREIDSQEPIPTTQDSSAWPNTDILNRPSKPGAIPRLQGPFLFDAEQMDNSDFADLHVIPTKLDMDDLMTGEDYEGLLEENEEGGCSVTVICISTTSGRLYVSLEINGVEGQWLPKAKKDTFKPFESKPCDLVLLESHKLVRGPLLESKLWPMFTKDVHSRYSFFVTTTNNVAFISLSTWIHRLEAELQSKDIVKSAFRLGILCDGPISTRELIIQLDISEVSSSEGSRLSASLVYSDFDLGYLLLTYRRWRPYATILEAPNDAALMTLSDLSLLELDSSHRHPPITPSRRPPYQVPAIVYSENPMTNFVEKHVPHVQRPALREQVRLSPLNLDLMAAVHRVLSAHTNTFERAVLDLSRRHERLQIEMRDQFRQIADIAERILDIPGEVCQGGQRKRSDEALDKRVEAAKQRQEQLLRRYDSIKSSVSKLGGRPLNEKEIAWISEVQALSDSVKDEEERGDGSDTLKQRFETAEILATDLLAEAKRISVETAAVTESKTPTENLNAYPRIPQRLQKAKVVDAMRMVERESAVIDAISSRLERLNTSLQK
ncbi:hypothetical protein Egran_06083 [Elaphomyces granulatus]|uniref:Uncharacterized protein n=1 Tax=Elaphomyces granulatus TaxID=519963 RepID=A0A232LQ72_9EURO|nr:hypothetical protein Egran_06083 [Elaphomyces granulatus]